MDGSFSPTFNIYSFSEKFYEELLFMKQIFTKHSLWQVPMLAAVLRVEESEKTSRPIITGRHCAVLWLTEQCEMIATVPRLGGSSEEM